MLSRRDLVGRIAAGTAAVAAAGVARTALGSTPPDANGSVSAGNGERPQAAAALAKLVDAEPPATLSAPAPWELLHPLAMGTVVAHGWRVTGLTGAVDGSCVLTLQNERGRAQRIHLCLNDGHPNGVAHTRRFDLVVMNGGEGDLPTEESLAQALAEVAEVLAANERDARQAPIVAALMPHNDRVRQFSGDMDRRLR